MTSVRKRKMNRSSVKKNTRRTKDKQRDINIHSNPIIAANWDKSLTLQQNYKRLGLTSKLGTSAGGQERKIETLTEYRTKHNNNKVSVDEISNTDDPSKIPEGEARLIRNPETNEVVKVIYGTMKVSNEDSSEANSTSIIKQLEEHAEKYAQVKKERTASERENDWLKSLFEKHGDDYEKMKWDKKLNIYQQSTGDLRRRITKWKKLNNLS
ncbi:ribosome biogenesis protein Nop16 [Scheffersomyces coipomensis]|uniref:ribosome biogenesis protein Nop16 n=1 Tax=Scheffersomyces coipomensis TaxID=1788519 RepID=UPI00315CB76B